jgi:hypothetical protein
MVIGLGAVVHLPQKTVNLRLVAWLLLGSGPTAYGVAADRPALALR